FRGERGRLALVFAFILLDSTFSMAGPYLIGRGVDALAALAASPASPAAAVFGITVLPVRALALAAFALLGAYLGGALLQTTEGWLMAGISQRMVRNIREGLFDKMQRLPLSFYDTRPHGDLMSRLTNDVDAVSVTVSQSAVQLMSGVVVVAGTLVIMLMLSPVMAVVSLLPVPLVFLLTSTISRRTRILFKEQQDALGLLNGHVEETVSGIQAVKAFGREPEAGARFGLINEELRRVGTRAQIWTGFLMPMMNVINNIGFAFVAVTGGWLALRGLISVGLIATFVSYSRQFVRPLNDIANTYNTLMSAVAGAERVYEVMDETEEPADSAHAEALAEPRGIVEFQGVSFGYRADVPVLRDVSFTAPAGSVTAIVGRTGAGKTTIVNLLSRFYEITSGKILIDGVDIRDYSRSSLRKAFGVVLQDGWLFAGTVRENILYGRQNATDSEMRRAAELAGASHAIERLPQGYETRLVESGANLSQGQRQLIGIARAVLAAPRLLILDEATSSVDARTELHIQQGMMELMKGRTSFIIAHRLSTIRDADTVLVVDAGKIVERGSPEELVQSDGYFRKLSETQRGGIEI
ncbi:MAG TPA: ABC transporter ATP-binding protein, partial [Spirochaetia bacterium]|nr:ABC transporter ATP-binding protein [Spirochaetia bacterium]